MLSDRVKNLIIRERCGFKEDVGTRVDKLMFEGFGHRCATRAFRF